MANIVLRTNRKPWSSNVTGPPDCDRKESPSKFAAPFQTLSVGSLSDVDDVSSCMPLYYKQEKFKILNAPLMEYIKAAFSKTVDD